MLSLTPLARPTAPLSRRNPVAKLAAATLISAAALIATDALTPALLLAAELAALPFCGIRPGALLRRSWVLIVSALGLAAVNMVFAANQTGPVIVDFGPLEIRHSALFTALALGLRALTFGMTGILVFATTDPTDLADSLVQQLRFPARFAIGSLAAFRMMPLLITEWQLITMARRARGVDAGKNPLKRLSLFLSTMFALLVGAIRRGTRLATAMDARGFDSGIPRTIARPQHMRTADWALILGTALVTAGAITVSVATGTFTTLVSG
ncbi:ABC transporter permease [Actinorhabdospora filicis]|uniref:ABC transporter permease n=1 Tax=Actinorhabdospora filicis TaxID=1785913 RepID=A0A9W6W4L5_9ACTN|nr:energy-coupling factor transporter transmembrane component T [Actinorhabdospora filicis]GLZ79387.1 ABC transporter permease [Actinorhabdospora filicis]